MIKGSIHQENMTILNIYAPNNKVLKYMKQKFIQLQGKIDKSVIITKDVISPL